MLSLLYSNGTARRRGLTGLAPVLLSLATLWAVSPAVVAAPLETYGRLPTLEEVALSPDGERLAVVKTTDNNRALLVTSLSDNKTLGGTKLGETKLRYLGWADNARLMIVTSSTGRARGLIGTDQEWYLLSIYDVNTHKVTGYPKYMPDLNAMNVVSGRIMVRRLGNDTVLFIPGIYVTDRTRLCLYEVNLATGRQTAIRLGSDATSGWLVDEAGDIVLESSYYERNQRWELKIRGNGHMVDGATGQAAIDVPQILGFGPMGDSVLVSAVETGDTVWRLMSLQDGKFGPPMEDSAILDEPIEDPTTHRLIGGITVDDEARYVFFGPAMRSRWKSLLNAFPGERVNLASMSGDLMKFVIIVDGTPDGLEYELIDMNTARAIPVGDVYAGIKSAFEVRRITYPAADGLKIPGYLTLPAGKPPTKLPLIVFPHGGPAVRDTGDFDWWAQAMASQGYAVLQPNYRGSAVNYSFIEAGFGEWGRKMQTDLSDGVRYLAKEGIIDPARVCIVGASYGGYAALAGVTLDPGVYRCAVSVAGISDLKRFLQWVKTRDARGEHTSERYWDRFMGIQDYKDLSLDAISPIRHLEALTVPVMLIHGRDDTVVPYEQSDIMLSALKKANKQVELVTMKKEDHWLSRGETRLLMLKSSVEFLKANNPPD